MILSQKLHPFGFFSSGVEVWIFSSFHVGPFTLQLNPNIAGSNRILLGLFKNWFSALRDNVFFFIKSGPGTSLANRV